MGNLTNRATDIEQLMEDGVESPLPRGYMGMSGLNHSCPRYLWYTFRYCYREEITKRKQRIFNRGHREEPSILEDLSKHCTIEGEQLEFVDSTGHIKGHCDGVARGVPHEGGKVDVLLEIKTMKDSKFKLLKKFKMKASNKVYWGQAQSYMKELDMELALFIVTNKDTEERYYEFVKYDDTLAEFLLDRATDIVSRESPPPKIGKPDWYECKCCSALDVCHYNEKPVRTCRTCKHAVAHDVGEWVCTSKERVLTQQDQELACDKYSILGGL